MNSVSERGLLRRRCARRALLLGARFHKYGYFRARDQRSGAPFDTAQDRRNRNRSQRMRRSRTTKRLDYEYDYAHEHDTFAYLRTRVLSVGE